MTVPISGALFALIALSATLHIIQINIARKLDVQITSFHNCHSQDTPHSLLHLFTHSYLWRNINATQALKTIKSFPLITVIITTHNDETYLEASLISVLNQSYPNLEIIIIDDASNDSSTIIIRRLIEMYRDMRIIRVLTQKVARGTYFGKNLGMLHATGSYVTFQDSDDISHVDRIMVQYLALSNAIYIGSMVHYVRVLTTDYQIVLNRGIMTRPAYPSFMFNRSVLLERVGFFDSVKVSADDELHSRIKRVFGPKGIIVVPLAYYFATQHPGSATNGKSETRLDLSQQNMTAFLGESRLQYVQNYQGWHNTAKTLYMPFPLLHRKFNRPEAHKINGDTVDNTVSVSIASNKNRTSLQKTILSLIHQVDHIYMYLNDYTSVPNWLVKLDVEPRARITVALGINAFGNIMDNGKAYFLDRIRGYHFTCDDDLIYPVDYVQKMILTLLHYDRKVVVGVHGINMTVDFASNDSLRYYDLKSRNVTVFSRKLDYEYQADILGTGTVAYHTDLLPNLKYEDFPVPGMMDIWLGIYAKDRSIPMIVVSREKNWIHEEKAAISIYSTGVRNDTVQTRLVRERLLSVLRTAK